MRSKFTTFIMSIIIILIFIGFILFGYILFNEFAGDDLKEGVENFVSTVTSLADGNEEENLTTPGIIETNINELQSANAEPTSIKYDNIVIDDYFYEQLEEPSKIFYRALESNKENLKTGTYKIEFGDAFSNVLNASGGEKLLGEYYQSAVETYIYDHPEVFYINVNKMYLNIETTTKGNNVTYNVFINSGNQANYLEDGYNSKEQIDSALAEIENVKNQILSQKTGDAYQDIKMVHDYLIDSVEYDTTLSNPDIYNIYGALVSKLSVCEGYAKSYKYLMDALGIPCVIVIGTGTNSSGQSENHAWNYVQINNIWYGVDTTWDDPVVIGGGRPTQTARYQYFLKGENTLNKDHFPNGQFTQGGNTYSFPSLSKNDFAI